MTITEWFARAVAAGLIPEWENIEAIYKPIKGWVIYYNHPNDLDAIVIGKHKVSSGKNFAIIQLRSEGKDLYSLEWRKPTEADIGKMCWCKDINSLHIYEVNEGIIELISNCCNFKYVLADYGQLCPTEQDFLKAYGE